MGGIVKAVTSPALGLAKSIANPVLGQFGLSTDDEQGAYATPEQRAQRAAQQYYSDYDKNMGAATKGIQEGALTKDLFGAGGLQEQLGKEQADLSSRGYGLTQGDREAYGQTAGDISRLFGQQEQDASKALARRGLGSAASGAGGAMFSGLAGNKNEMLARAQTDIAQKRMADTQQRLQATRNQMQSLGQQGTNMANRAWGQKGASLGQAAGYEGGMNEANRQTLADQQAAVKPGLFSTIGQGLQRGIGQMAQSAPGMLVGGPGGAMASGGGGQMGGAGGAGGGFGSSSYASSGMSQSNPYNKTGYSLFGSR